MSKSVTELAAEHPNLAEYLAQLERQESILKDENEKLGKIIAAGVPLRKEPPDTVKSLTHKFDVGGYKGYIIIGCYPDTQEPCTLEIHLQKEGSTLGGAISSFARLFSVSLQYGIPVASLVRMFEFQRFEPSGQTPNPNIGYAYSVIDYIARYIGSQFIPGYETKITTIA